MVTIDGVILKQMIISGANNIFNSYPDIDALNVFPVPDGDTGTNMNLTMNSGVKEVSICESNDICDVAKAFSRGLLFGARGNSGVILSQIFRGFAEGLKGKKSADAVDLAEAFLVGKEVAYKAVLKPVEGTILTVEREAATVLEEKAERGMPIDEALDIFLAEAEASLKRTPNLLPVLKEVGVVDSGGAGFCKIIEGFSKALHNDVVQKSMPDVVSSPIPAPKEEKIETSAPVQAKLEHKDFGYCTEFILQLPNNPSNVGKHKFDEKRFRSVLNNYGNSIVAVRDDDLVKVHIHAKKPGTVFNYAQQFGEFLKMKIESMTQQHEHIIDLAKEGKANSPKTEYEVSNDENQDKKETPLKEYGSVAVCAGNGVADLFKNGTGVDEIVKGGQTMNPSTADIVDAIKKTHSKNVFVFPNNGNIIMAASSAADFLEEKGINVIVVPTKSIPEGLIAAMMFNPSVSPDSNKTEMLEAISQVKSGEVTYAVRDTTIGGVSIKKDQFMGMHGKSIISVSNNKFDSLNELLASMVDNNSSIITVICGEDISSEEREKVSKELQEKYGKQADIDVKDGGQPVYSFLVSVED